MTSAAHVLLLGGTSETAPLALKLVQAGFRVLVSTATDARLEIGDHPAIHRRCGRLDSTQLAQLVTRAGLSAIVDASHPYATELHQAAQAAASHGQCPYLRYQRPPLLDSRAEWIVAEDHHQAARLACAGGKPILLTTGSRHLAPYVAAARHHQLPLFARVLDHPEAIAACDQAGLSVEGRIFGRGPFTLEQNRAVLRRHHIGVLVTKDSGGAGGVAEKREAARLQQCQLIVVQRPHHELNNYFSTMDGLVAALRRGATASQPDQNDPLPEVCHE